MSERNFAHAILTSLDPRPVVLPSDHVEDLRKLPANFLYTLPKLPSDHPLPSKRLSSNSNIPGSEPVVTIHLTALRTSAAPSSSPSASEHSYLPLKCKLPITTSIVDLKHLISSKARVPIAKIKLLYEKRPVGDTKTIKEITKGEGKKGVVELGVMIMGGAGGGKEKDEVVDSAVLATPEFWTDLKVFLSQRLKDEREGERVLSVFREAWDHR